MVSGDWGLTLVELLTVNFERSGAKKPVIGSSWNNGGKIKNRLDLCQVRKRFGVILFFILIFFLLSITFSNALAALLEERLLSTHTRDNGTAFKGFYLTDPSGLCRICQHENKYTPLTQMQHTKLIYTQTTWHSSDHDLSVAGWGCTCGCETCCCLVQRQELLPVTEAYEPRLYGMIQ